MFNCSSALYIGYKTVCLLLADEICACTHSCSTGAVAATKWHSLDSPGTANTSIRLGLKGEKNEIFLCQKPCSWSSILLSFSCCARPVASLLPPPTVHIPALTTVSWTKTPNDAKRLFCWENGSYHSVLCHIWMHANSVVENVGVPPCPPPADTVQHPYICTSQVRPVADSHRKWASPFHTLKASFHPTPQAHAVLAIAASSQYTCFFPNTDPYLSHL